MWKNVKLIVSLFIMVLVSCIFVIHTLSSFVVWGATLSIREWRRFVWCGFACQLPSDLANKIYGFMIMLLFNPFTPLSHSLTLSAGWTYHELNPLLYLYTKPNHHGDQRPNQSWNQRETSTTTTTTRKINSQPRHHITRVIMESSDTLSPPRHKIQRRPDKTSLIAK